MRLCDIKQALQRFEEDREQAINELDADRVMLLNKQIAELLLGEDTSDLILKEKLKKTTSVAA